MAQHDGNFDFHDRNRNLLEVKSKFFSIDLK
jgi:hypothetical protein